MVQGHLSHNCQLTMNQKPCLHEGFSFPVDLYYFNLSNCQKSLWCAEISIKSVHTCTRTSHAYFSCHPSEPGKSCFQSWFSSLSSLKSLLFLQCLHLHLRIFVQQHFLNNKDRCLKKKTSHIEHVPMNIPANNMLKILEEKTNQKPQQVNSATFRSFMLSVFLCISLHMLLYWS